MKRFALLCALAACFAAVASAQDYSRVDAFGGYSYFRFQFPNTSFNANGGSGQLTYNVNSVIGVTGDFGAYHVGESHGVSGTVATYMVGPKFTLRRGKWSPFAEGLFGGAWLGSGFAEVCDSVARPRPQGEVCEGNSSSLNTFAMAFGGGVDYKLMNHISVRLFDADYLFTHFNLAEFDIPNNHQNNLRVSTGVVFNF
jgi:opacity protein-like surface antigen